MSFAQIIISVDVSVSVSVSCRVFESVYVLHNFKLFSF